MLHPAEIANLQQTIDRTHAAIGTLESIEQELRLIKKGMAPGPEKTRIEQIVRLTRETLTGLQRKLPMLHEVRSSSGPDGAASRPGAAGADGTHAGEGGRSRRKPSPK